MMITPSAIPTPIPAFDPPLRPEEGLVVGAGNLGKLVIYKADAAALEGLVVRMIEKFRSWKWPNVVSLTWRRKRSL